MLCMYTFFSIFPIDNDILAYVRIHCSFSLNHYIYWLFHCLLAFCVYWLGNRLGCCNKGNIQRLSKQDVSLFFFHIKVTLGNLMWVCQFNSARDPCFLYFIALSFSKHGLHLMESPAFTIIFKVQATERQNRKGESLFLPSKCMTHILHKLPPFPPN